VKIQAKRIKERTHRKKEMSVNGLVYVIKLGGEKGSGKKQEGKRGQGQQ